MKQRAIHEHPKLSLCRPKGQVDDGSHTRTQNTNRRNHQWHGMHKGFQVQQIRIRGPLRGEDFSRWRGGRVFRGKFAAVQIKF